MKILVINNMLEQKHFDLIKEAVKDIFPGQSKDCQEQAAPQGLEAPPPSGRTFLL